MDPGFHRGDDKCGLSIGTQLSISTANPGSNMILLTAVRRLMKTKKLLLGFLLLALGCASVPDIDKVPSIVLGEPSFFPTIAAHTDAPILAGNRVELLFNGEEIFPAMLRASAQRAGALLMPSICIRAAPLLTSLSKLSLPCRRASKNLDRRSWRQRNARRHPRAMA